MIEFKEKQLLFGIESSGREGILSFVHLPSLDSDSPEFYFCRVNKSWLDDFVPGGLYRLEVKNGKLVQYIKEREFLITQPYYLMLLENKHALLHKPGPFVPRQYYTFNDWKALFNFGQSKMQKFIAFATKTLLYGLCSILPCLLYIFSLFKMFTSDNIGIKAPILTIALMPFLVWSIIALLTLCDQLLLKWPFTRYKVLRDFTIRTSGMRREIGLKPSFKKKLLIWGAVAFGILVISVIFYLVDLSRNLI